MIMKSHRTIIATLLLSIAVLMIYFNVQYFEFVNYDDPAYITEHQIIKSGLTWKGVVWAFTTNYYGNWHPVTTISFMFEYEIFRLRAGAYHWNNLLFHILNSLLLFLVFKRLTHTFWQSLAVAALFALHPLHVESVAWISGRKDVLCALFWFLTMYAYARYAEQQTLLRYVFVLLSFTLGLMAKPMLVTLPFVFLLLDYWPLSRFSFRQMRKSITKLIPEKIPLIILSIASSIITFLAQIDSQSVVPLELLSLQTRLSNAFVAYVKYIYKTVWPVDLAVLYPYSGAVSLDQLLFSIIVLIIITVIVLYFIQDYRYLFIGWFWYLGTLIPVIGIVQVGSHAMADRYTYIPLIGLFIMAAWGIPDLLKDWHLKKIVMIVSATVTIVILMITSWSQVQVWENSVTLFQRAVAVTQHNYIAHSNLGLEYARQGKDQEAFFHYQEALKISPNFSDAHNNLGALLAQTGNIGGAIQQFRLALKAEPGHSLAEKNLRIALEVQRKRGVVPTQNQRQ
jgi:tetratricopeptide (TPR) repeat protein